MNKALVTLPALNNMSKKERKAFEEGIWDGIEKRNANPRKEELAAARKHKRRQKDRLNNTLHYGLLAILFFFLFGSYALSIILEF